MDTVLATKISKIILPQIKGRGNIVNWHGIRVVNESYNASPSSMKNALENFKKLEGKKLCILGEMRELGDMSLEFHQNLKPYLQNFDGIILTGKFFEKTEISNAKYFENYASCLEFLKSNISMLKKYDNILVKASNGVLLWKLFDEFFV
jgi:UDP-N-acetylmuramoyl-tripeptide--D-alanyl-D-alanine ligase